MNKIDIINTANMYVGLDPISGLEDGSETARKLNLIYNQRYEYCLSKHDWLFATKTVVLNGIPNTKEDIIDYEFSFQLPADQLKVSEIKEVDTKTLLKGGYKLIADKIYSDTENLYISYVYKIEEGILPSYFIEYFKYDLAYEIALIFSVDVALRDQLYVIAYGSVRESGGKYQNARNLDKTNQKDDEIMDNPLMFARFGYDSGNDFGRF